MDPRLGPPWTEQPVPPECPACGGKPDHSPSTCTIEPEPETPLERARRAKKKKA